MNWWGRPRWGPAFCVGWEPSGDVLMPVLHQIRNLFISDGMKKLVGWEYPIFGQAFLNLMEWKKFVGWGYPILGQVLLNLMEWKEPAFGCRHHRRFEYFCHDGNPLLFRLDLGFSFHPRWGNFLVDGIHLPCLTIGAEKHPSAMDESWKRSFFPVHRVWDKPLGDGKKCRNKLFHSIGFEIDHRAMEESAGASFSRTIGFGKRLHAMEEIAEQVFRPSDLG